MQSHTKECPFCGVSVQKNEGCYCMTCSNCSRQWCWMCKEDFSTHTKGHFKCTKYNTGEFALRDSPQHQDRKLFQQRIRLQKLAKYYKSYNKQTSSINLENTNQIRKIDADVITAITTEISSLDVTFIPNARLEIKKCREALKYSFVVLFFMKGKKSLKMVQFMQENLSIAIEKLLSVLQNGNGAYETAAADIEATSTTANATAANPAVRSNYFKSAPKKSSTTTTTSTTTNSPDKSALDPPTVRKHIKIANAARDALFAVLSGIELPSVIK